MKNLLQPYEGSAPYVFVSYSHKDSDRVFTILQRLQTEGIRIWYDEGIEWGSKWDNYIAKHVRNCACVMAFISNNFTNSPHCEDEISHAKTCGKNFLPIYLEPVQLEEGMEMRLGRYQAAHFFKYPAAEIENFYSQLLKSKFLTSCYAEKNNYGVKKQSENKADDFHSTLSKFNNSTTYYEMTADSLSKFDDSTTYYEMTTDPFSKFDDSTTYYKIQTDNLQNNSVTIVHRVNEIYKEVVAPIIFILDTSGSMSGSDIENLKNALKQTIGNLRSHSMESKMKNLTEMNNYAYVTYKIAIITFDSYAKILMNYTDVDKINDLPNFEAFGGTNLDDALKHAKNIIDNPSVTLEDWRNPSVILVTDGCPIGGYQKTLDNFITKGRSAKSHRYAIGIGDFYDKQVLTTFAHTSVEATNTSELASALRVFINDIIARMVLILW